MLSKEEQFRHLTRFAALLGFYFFKVKGIYHVKKGIKFVKFEEIVSIYNKGVDSKFFNKHLGYIHKTCYLTGFASIPRKPLTIQRKDLKGL